MKVLHLPLVKEGGICAEALLGKEKVKQARVGGTEVTSVPT